MTRLKLALAALCLCLPGAARAACDFQNAVPVTSLTAAFEAWKAVAASMAQCGNVRSELDQEFRSKQPAAFAANPALYDIGGVSNGTLVPLLLAGTIRPLDALIGKYGQQLQPNQLIKIDGRTMAVAMDVNAQNLIYRADILKDLGIAVPATWDEVLAAAEKIKASGRVAYPLGGTMKPGFDLSQEFVNMFLGYGGSFTRPDNTPAIASDAGLKTLAMLKKLSAYMDPEYLVSESTFVQKQFQQGKIAMANLWASRAAALDDAKESQVVGKIAMAAAPRAVAGGKSATTLWWDGVVIAKNIPDDRADAAFRVAMHGIGPQTMAAAPGAVVWLVKGYVPGKFAEGVVASANGGAPSYPSTAVMGLMSTVIGEGVADHLTGRKTAEKTLADIEAAYSVRAREQGLLK